MNFDEEESKHEIRNGAKKRFRKNKLKVVFNPEDRKSFLLGFRKRKQERKEKYIEKLERDLMKERKRLKQQTQRDTKKLSNSHSVLPEVKSIIANMPEKEETYDLGNTLVSITSLDDQFYRNLPTKTEGLFDAGSDDHNQSSKELLTKLKKKRAKQLDGFTSDDDELSAIARNDPFFNPINDDELSGSESEEDGKVTHYNPLEMLRQNTESKPVEPGDILSKAKLERRANSLLQGSEVFKKMQRIKQKRSKKFRQFRLQSVETSAEGTKGSKAPKGKTCRIKGAAKSKHGKKRK